MDLRRQIALVRQRFPLFLASILLGVVAAFIVTSFQQKVYEARGTLIVGQFLSGGTTNYEQVLTAQRLSSTYASVATTRPILDEVIAQLKLDMTADQLQQRVRADAPLDSSLLTISVQDQDPARAAAIVNALSARMIAMSPAIQGRQTDFQKAIDSNISTTETEMTSVRAEIVILTALSSRTAAQQDRLQSLQGQLSGLQSFYASLLPYSSADSANYLTLVDPAVTPTAPIAPNRSLNLLVGAILGLLVAAAFVSVADYLDDTIKDADGVAAIGSMSALGVIPLVQRDRGRSRIYSLAMLLHPRSRAAEAYRTLRTNIDFASIDSELGTLLVTSSIPGEGKSEVAANLAVAFAETGRRVLLVDADLRKPMIDQIFDLPNTEGLTTLVLSDSTSVDAVARATEIDALRVVTSGPLPPNPLELLGSKRMRTVLGRLAADADLVIFDSPPQGLADAAILSSFLDGTLLVIGAAHTHTRAIAHARESLERAGANVLGAVLNRSRVRDGFDDYAGYYAGVPHGTRGPVAAAEGSAPDSGR